RKVAMAKVAETAPPQPPPVPEVDPGRWLMLAVILVGAFMSVVDGAIVNVAIPAIRADLHASFGEVEFIVAMYTLVYAVLLITGGRMGDLLGRKPLFIAGLVIFTTASALCGLAPDPTTLIAFRAIQGLGAAL